MEKEYRISEHMRVFSIEVKSYTEKGILWWKKKEYKWFKANCYGGVSNSFRLIPRCESFKTLELAIERINEFQKGIKYHSYKGIDSDPEDIIFKIMTETSYSESDVTDFILLTGAKLDDATVILNRFRKSGIPNLTHVNLLAKLGYFNYLESFQSRPS